MVELILSNSPKRAIKLAPQWHNYMVYEWSRAQMGLPPTEVTRRLIAAAPEVVFPTHGEALKVAERIWKDPAQVTSIRDFSREHFVSERTLQRQFMAQTGLTFSDWRASVRVHAAAALIAAGEPLIEVAAQVGFQAVSSLTRAFRRHTGFTAAQCVRRGLIPVAVPANTIDAGEQDLVLYMYEGTGTVTTTGYCRFVAKGDTVTLPAGTNTRLDVAAGSVAVPLGTFFTAQALELTKTI